MRKKFLLLLLLNCICICGCQGNTQNTALPSKEQQNTDASTLRDNTPRVLVPSADGTKTLDCDVATVDLSHTDQGYCMVNYSGASPKVKMQLSTPDGTTYTYSLHGGYETFPLTGGNGTYQIVIFENVKDDQYTTALSEQFDTVLTDEFSTYLYPNQYVNFNTDSKVVEKGKELAEGSSSDLDVVTNVYNYIAENITYDREKAANVESGYLPVVDEILSSGTGICFDYAAVMASMLRSQGIPTRLEVGYAKDAYHAWVSIYLSETGWVNGLIEFDGVSWKLMDPTFAASKSEKKLKQFIGDGSNYQTKYVY